MNSLESSGKLSEQYPWLDGELNTLDVIEYVEAQELGSAEQAYLQRALESDGAFPSVMRQQVWDCVSMNADEFADFVDRLPTFREDISSLLNNCGLASEWIELSDKNETGHQLRVSIQEQTTEEVEESTPTIVVNTVPEVAPELEVDQSSVTLAEPVENEALPDLEVFSPSIHSDEAKDFLELINEVLDDDDLAIELVGEYAANTSADYIDLPFTEEELTAATKRVDGEIGSFIQNKDPITTIQFITLKDARQLTEIFNPINLLAFAKDQVKASEGTITIDRLEMIYRYANVLRQLSHLVNHLVDHEAQLNVHEPTKKDGASTWGGDLHGYGFEKGGVIHGGEYQAFSEEPESERKVPIIIDGKPVRWATSIVQTKGSNAEL